MPASRKSGGFGLPSFFGMVGAVMAALKLKEHYGQCKLLVPFAAPNNDLVPKDTRVSNDEEGQIALAEEDEGAQLESPTSTRKRQRKKGCCVCCGLDCSLFWKAFGIVVAGFSLWYLIKFVFWASTPAPTGLEDMPDFSTSLTCLDAPYIYNDGETSIQVAMGEQFDHTIDIRGGSTGTILLTQAAPEATAVEYKITVRSNDAQLLEKINFQYPPAHGDPVTSSRLSISTPAIDDPESSCLRYDIVMYIPKSLRKLHVAPHTTTQVKFDPKANIDLVDFYVTLFSLSDHNLVLPSESFRANKLALEIYRGWIVGDASILNTTSIITQRGNGVANVRVHPTPPLDPTAPDPIFLQTTTGAGRTDIFFIGDKRFPHRPISSVHMSSRNADVYLNYRESEYSGRIQMTSKSYTATGVQAYSIGGEGDGMPAWTHWVGEQDGADKMLIKSKGWTGLYF
ncbi:hypothetical protein D9758_002064 [Tetrapyrgos nigripes]|uniref:Uncharacterized protein n=1 Tax=Tetrapyrgos nigripes TaxID=182062 RepID=A0A8H5GTQ0_9AGAR|nr:hypothetical protein D9758_002064 [Tetrapyrgos nigripes]